MINTLVLYHMFVDITNWIKVLCEQTREANKRIKNIFLDYV